jgi:hypothetical protein
MLTWLLRGLGLHAGGGQEESDTPPDPREGTSMSVTKPVGMGCIPEIETYLVGNQAYMQAVTAEMVLTMFWRGGVSASAVQYADCYSYGRSLLYKTVLCVQALDTVDLERHGDKAMSLSFIAL